MSDKQKAASDIQEKTKVPHISEAEAAHSKLLADADFHKPASTQSKSDSHSARTFEHDASGKLTKVVEKDGTYYQRNEIGASHMKGDRVISSGSLSVNEKTKEVTYTNQDNWTNTTLRADGSSILSKHMAGFGNEKGPILEIHNPSKADGTAGDTRKFTYDNDGKITGYSIISANKDLCSNWKTNDGIHWRKVDEKGQPIKDKDLEKDAKNVLIGRMYVTSDGTFAFDNKRKADDEAPHWTVVTADGSRHERITNLENKSAADSMHSLQAELVKAHFNEIKPNNPVGWMGYIGMQDVQDVLKDPEKSEAQKMTAAILRRCMEKHGIGLIHANELNGKMFEQTVAGMSLQDVAYDEIKDKS